MRNSGLFAIPQGIQTSAPLCNLLQSCASWVNMPLSKPNIPPCFKQDLSQKFHLLAKKVVMAMFFIVGFLCLSEFNNTVFGQTTIYSQNFDGAHGWTFDATSHFSVGAPAAGNTCTTPRSASNVLGTILNGTYSNNWTEANSYAISPAFDCSAHYVLTLSFYSYSVFEATYDFGYVYVSGDNGTTWTNVETFDGTETGWTLHTFDISDIAASKSQVRIKITMISDGSQLRTGWNIDDLTVSAYPVVNYYSKTSGNLNTPGTWGTNTDGSGTAPLNFTANYQIFNIRNNTTPTISTSWTVSGTGSSVVVGDGTNSCTFTVGGTLVFTSKCSVSNNGVLKVSSTAGTPYSGTLTVNAGGTYEHARNGGTIPTATWDVASNCNITGVTSTIPGGQAQTFGNFLYNCPGQTGSENFAPTAISGNLEINSTGTSQLVLNMTPLTVVNYTQTGGNFAIASGAARTLNVSGNLSIINGTLTLSRTNNQGTLNVMGNFSHTGGTITETANSNGSIYFSGTSPQTYTSGGTVSQKINFTVNSGSTLDVGTSVIDGSIGTFTLSSGAGIVTAHSQGLSTTAGTGSIQVTGTKTYSTGADYTYNGAVNQVTGNGVTGANDLTINNTGGTGSNTVSLTGSTPISGNLTVASGIFDMGAFTANRSTPGGTLTVASTLLLGGTTGGQTGSNFPTNFSTLTMTGGTVSYDTAGGGQTIYATPTYNNLTLGNTSGIQTAGGNITTTTLNNNSNAANVLNMGTYTLAVTTPNNTGTIRTQNTSGTPISTGKTWGGTVTFDASTAQTIPASTFNNLTLANAGGATLSGAVSVNGIFALSNGILTTTGTNLLSVTNTATSAVSGGSANSFIKGPVKWSLATGTYLFPVGKSTGNYFPFTLTTSAAAAPVVTVEAFDTDAGAGATFDETLASISHSEYWQATLNSGTFTGKVSLTRINPVITGQVIGQSTLQGGSYTSIGGTTSGSSITNSDDISTLGYFVVASKKPHTYYSYQSGDWKLANTWTTDPSGSFWVNGGVPSAIDNVVILNGRTVTVNEGGKSVNSLEIKLGGTLDLLATNPHYFGTVTGEGILKLASSNFPGGVYTSFVAATGGTVEYYNLNNQRISNTQLTYNKLVVSNYTASDYITFLDNSSNNITYTVNGTFDLKNFGLGSLTFYFGNPTPSDNLINMTVKGNFSVTSGCNIRVNHFASTHTLANSDTNPSVINPVHSLTIEGDFTNNGSVRFTGLPSPFNDAYYLLTTTAYSGTNYGDVQLFFTGATNNIATCNGTTDFFRIIVDKGSDQTYTLEVNSSNAANFVLYAPNNQGLSTFAGYGYCYKALYIKNGTLKLNSNINVPSLTEGGQDFNLLPAACLWVNGANVSTTVSGTNGRSYQAASSYGRLRISSGQFSTSDAAGIVLGDIGVPEIDLEGTGTLDVSQVWNNLGSTNLISYRQTGGTANFRLQGENHTGAMFSLDNPNTVFYMSGGTINFTNNTFADNSTQFQVLNIQVQSGNYSVTGGTVNVNLPSSTTVYTANSSIPFYNMNILNRTGSGTMTFQMNNLAPNLSVLNDLRVGNGAVLDMNAYTIGLNVGRNFDLDAGSTYMPGGNTTTFNGSGVQTFTNAGTITSGLNHLTLSNASNTSITNNLTARGNLTVGSGCLLNDQGFTISVAGNISNSGTHNSQANGSILLTGTAAQTIGGSGSGVFGNFGVNKTSGTATLTIGQSITGNLRLVNGILTIGSYNLKLSATSSIYDALTGTAAPTTFGDSKMIKTTGDASDGGVTKSFNSTGSFLYPFGTSTYHPATISFSQAPTHWGDVTIRPVAVSHPSTDIFYESLKYYWKVTSSSITGIQPGSVSHTYHYSISDVTTTDNQYITGLYNPFAWTKGATEQVDIIGKNIYFPSVQILDGEYTAGIPLTFGVVKVYYSHANGDWSTASTWSNVSNADATNAATPPGPNDLVVIGDGGSYNHVVTMSANTQKVSGLQLSAGSTLDLKITTGHNFGTVTGSGTGSGTLRISSSVTPAVFPSGDFGNFLGSNGGTVEYYTETAPGNIGIAFTLPTTYLTGTNTVSITNYNNLIISPATGRNITMPDTDLLIYKDLKVSVSGTSVTGIAQLNNQNTTRTVTVNGNLNVNNGILRFTNVNSRLQNVIVIGDVIVASGATFDVAANLTATNTLSIQGNLTNNGIFDMIAGTGQVCNVTFTGAANKQINGTTANRTDFNILTVNKGVDRTSMLEVTVNALTLNVSLASAITLTNGTFRLSNSNLTITLSTTSPFAIPATGCLSANIGTINIGAANNNAADLLLQGKLEVMNLGIVNIGNGSGSNNDIEYAPTGNPEINISGGSLVVDGQIRRNITNNAGSLIYNQTGGTVTVKGNNFDNSRGMFELLNAGSQFNVSGGNLIIVKAGIVSLADIYLEPGSSIVNGSNGGHTLILGNASTPTLQIFNLNTTAPLWNLTVDGSTNNKTANLTINPISILNNLTINGNGAAGTGSVFKANELNVTIGGSLINNNLSSGTGIATGGYQAGAAGSTQNTTFTGTGTITGTGTNLTNFANLVIGSSSTTPAITLGTTNSKLRVNTNLTLTSGTISDAGNTITVIGNINNSATHSSPLSLGGIFLTNSVKQVITTSGSGKLGNVTVDNASGVDVIGDSWITGQLTLTAGLLYINDYLLVMDVNSTFGGTYDVNRMIKLNGANSDKGVQKYFSGSASNFVFPIGSAGKFRPVTFSFTSANAGSITVVPVNTAHPSVFAPTTDQLNYYWKTTITGFSGVSAVTQVYQYGTAEVTGNESAYISARFSGSSWIQYATSTISATNHTITINENDLFTGEYTAGEIANFGTVHKLYSKQTGNWTDFIWAEDSPSNAACGYYPNGNPVFIQTGHTISMDINGASAASVDIQGIFDLKQSINHSLGSITDTTHAGTGKMMIENSPGGMFVFPGGNYDRFMASTGTTVELYGSIDAQMPLKPGNLAKPYQNLILTGTGIKYMSAEVLKILGNLTINNGAKLSAVLFNMPLYILKNWTDLNTAPSTGGFVPGTGLVSFEGSSAQTLTVNNSNITENYYNFQINNPNGVTIAGGGKAQISNNLSLISGAITTNTTNSLTLTNSSTSAVTGGSVTSYIDGPLRKQISNGSFFTFPVGKKNASPRYGQAYLSGVVTSGIWEAEYFNTNPNSNTPSLTITSMLTPVASVSNNEYWLIKGVSSGSANVTLRWDANSGYHTSTPADRSKIRVVEWDPSGTPQQWVNRGNVVTDNGADAGLVTTDNPIALADGTNLHYLTIGSGNLPLPTATITNFPLAASFCNNSIASTTVTVALTGTAPWSLTYKLGSVSTTINNIASSPVSIVLTSASSGITQPITSDTNFNFNITNVNDFNGVAGISDYTTTMVLTVHPIPDNTITGKTLVGTGEVVAYTTPADANTYTWTVSSNGTITSGAGTNSINITWGTGSPGPYTVGLTKNTTAGCAVTNSISVTTSNTPTPVITGKQKVCAGSFEVYSTPFVSGHSYDWSISSTNGSVTSGDGTSSITIRWLNVSTNNVVSVKETVIATGISNTANKTVDIGIQPSAGAPSFVAPTSVCIGTAPSFTINNSELYVRYQLRNNSDNSNSGLFVDGTGGTITLTGSPIVATTTYNIYAYTLAPFDCGIQLSNPSGTATVVPESPGSWMGTINTDWNTSGNWNCVQIPSISTNVLIASGKSNYPTLSTGNAGTANDLTIQSGASVTVSGNTLQIAGTISNSGTFTASAGTIEMKGSSSQTIPSGTFASNLVANLIVNNSSGVSLGGTLNITGILKATTGDLASNGYLKLISTASQTALIDGSGSGQVNGNVVMQRYLASSFGYKYFSPPFTSLTVGDFAPYVALGATFPSFYKYDENNSLNNLGVDFISGWVKWTNTSNALSPMAGYAANFGSSTNPNTVELTGVVNNGDQQVTLYDHNRTYTQGFNLVGNPYPSPIDWEAVFALSTSIDKAIYFYENGVSDQYSGVYSSYINGIGDSHSNIIPYMQGFFVNVSGGSGTLRMANSVRTTDLGAVFKSAFLDTRTILRFTANFDGANSIQDPFFLYFDPSSTLQFDRELDALKMMNTDNSVPNFYAIGPDGKKVSISAIPFPDVLTKIQLGVKTSRDGWVNFNAKEINLLPSDLNIYLLDKEGNTTQDMKKNPVYRAYLKSGEYSQRFLLVFSLSSLPETNTITEKMFTLSRTADLITAIVNLPLNTEGNLRVTNMQGQLLFSKIVYEKETVEISTAVNSGVYIISLKSGKTLQSEKIVIRK